MAFPRERRTKAEEEPRIELVPEGSGGVQLLQGRKSAIFLIGAGEGQQNLGDLGLLMRQGVVGLLTVHSTTVWGKEWTREGKFWV